MNLLLAGVVLIGGTSIVIRGLRLTADRAGDDRWFTAITALAISLLATLFTILAIVELMT